MRADDARPSDGWARACAAAGAVVLADQVSKAVAVAAVAPGHSERIFFGVELTNIRNPGIAFGALGGARVAVAVLIASAVAALLVYFARHPQLPWLWLPVGAVLGGALGNLADRAREGAVVDFLDPVLWPAFNVADAAIVIGTIGLLYVIEGRPGGKG